jgi:hypothetical protein
MKLTVTSWGTEMGRIAVPGHPRQKSFKTSFSVDKKKTGCGAHTCHPRNEGKLKIGGL